MTTSHDARHAADGRSALGGHGDGIPAAGGVPARTAPGEAANGPRHAQRPRRTLLRLAGTTLAWTIAAVCFAAILALVVVPRLSGSTPYTVLTGSMRPLMPPGTMVVVRPVDFADIRVGDVVTYQLDSGVDVVVTHRVVGIDVTDAGVRLRTQGDANPSPDAEGVREKQVRGVVWYWIPLVGYVTAVGDGDARLVIARVIGGGLLLYAVLVVVRELRAKRAQSRATSKI